MEEFAACWEGLEDPRTGNAGLHDLHELLMIALCTVLSGGQGAGNAGGGKGPDFWCAFDVGEERDDWR